MNLVVTELVVVVIREKHLVTATEVTFFKEKIVRWTHIIAFLCNIYNKTLMISLMIFSSTMLLIDLKEI